MLNAISSGPQASIASASDIRHRATTATATAPGVANARRYKTPRYKSLARI
jgi:hypothetical protein